MAKGKKTAFFCQNCGYESGKWMGQCPACREWNTFAEEIVEKSAGAHTVRRETAEPVRLSSIKSGEESRISSGCGELDRVLGGGIVPGSLVLVGGDPGIGKSTLLLQVCKNMTQQGRRVLYISGEESLQQIKMRAERIGKIGEELLLLCETNLETIKSAIQRVKPEAVVIDSIQTMYNETVGIRAGQCLTGEGVHLIADADREGNGDYRFYSGTCDKGGSGGRPQSAGAYG